MAKIVLFLCVSSLVILASFVLQVDAQRRSRSNCFAGSYCDRCPEGEYKTLTVRGRDIKVCCSGCGTYFRARCIGGDNIPFCTCDNVSSIRGDCWKGDQCDQCLAGPNAGYVGRINSVPICCANCEQSGWPSGPDTAGVFTMDHKSAPTGL